MARAIAVVEAADTAPGMRSTSEMAIESLVLSGLEPAAFWQRFEELTKIARPSRHEEPVIAVFAI